MKQLKLIVWLLAVLLQQQWHYVTVAANSVAPQGPTTVNSQSYAIADREISTPGVLGSLYRKSRQSRCVRCYEDRYADDRSRYYGSASSASRSVDDRGSWYYPSYDRYDDRTRSGGDYDRYSAYYRDRDDRYNPRTYDRYEARGYEGRGYDRGYEGRGSERGYEGRGSDRGYEGRGYDGRGYDRGYDRRGSYDMDRYGDYYRDRYSDRTRPTYGGGYNYERDYYDRSRYDFRNYRPWDETYRGQSGFDSSGRGYYFAKDKDEGRRYLPDDGRRDQQRPCGTQVSNCPYGGTATTVTSQPIDSRSPGGSGSYAINKNTGANSSNNDNNNSSRSGWTYVSEDDKNTRGGDRDRGGERDRSRERDQQSSSYGGRPPRPLGGSYLFDRDNNAISDDKSDTNKALNNAASDQNSKTLAGSQGQNEATQSAAAAGGKQ